MTRLLHRVIRCVMACALLAGAICIHAAEPIIRVQVDAKQPVLAGQEIRIDVTVMAPNFFTSAPDFPALQVPGAILTMPDERAALATETVSGETYATIQKTYLFAAQQAGDFTLPQVQIAFTYSGDDGKPKSGSVTMPPTRITARLPAGEQAQGGRALPVAPLTIQQRFDRATTGLKAGDALVRTIDIFATQTQAMMIPPPHFEAPDGVRVFTADPVLKDENGDRGGFQGGRRVDHVTYVFEKAGRYTLPAIEVRWFDAASNKPQTAQAPAVTVVVAPGAHAGDAIAPEAGIAAPGTQGRRRIHWALVGWGAAALLAIGAFAWLVRVRGPQWRASRQARRAAHEVSDDVMFRAVLDACAQDDPKNAHARLLDWCRRHAACAPRAWAATLHDPTLEAQIDALQRKLYAGTLAPDTPWKGPVCATVLRKAHDQWLRQHKASAPPPWRGNALGPLNPSRKQA
ncbi:BatD family protein [Variovorax sp. J22R133]|uniref:BatD family protein n=1 Tax=Variovorax brevis TaxID=3053503 RepID=UPI0025749108|nr:BatD family protein [Variovorax sp. J22R133]MDM0111075.1 BatD family protein [Variovorax sp. J22R133]